MNASLIITFSDGTTKELPLGDRLSVIDIPDHMRQSVTVNQKANGGFHLAYTKPIMDGKIWWEITIRKDGSTQSHGT